MKTVLLKLPAVLAVTAVLLSCGGVMPDSGYTPDLPELPAAWTALLGEPHWRLEWFNADGEKVSKMAAGAAMPALDLPQTWVSAVIAWPFWPEWNIAPGIFKPAGAVFPFDAGENSLHLSWQAGVDAVFYHELALAAAADPAATAPKVSRLPANFNWPRFRQLFAPESGIKAEVLADPWLADWRSIAAKTAHSGFDKRRLISGPYKETPIPVPPGPWYGASPFAEPVYFADDALPLFPARESVEVWISTEGILRLNNRTWILAQW
jgi:hypothetical protein